MDKKKIKHRLSRSEKKEETRQKIKQSAMELFAARGMEAVSIDEISETAGYSRGAFYSNFSNREAVMEELISEGFDSDIAALERMEDSMNSDQLAEAYQEIGTWFSSHPENVLWMMEFQLSVARHPELKPAYLEQHRKLRNRIKSLIHQWAKTNGFKNPLDAEYYCDLLMSTLSGLSMTKVLYGEEIPETLFRDYFKTILKGIENQMK